MSTNAKIVSRAAWIKEFNEHCDRIAQMLRGPCSGGYDISGVVNPCREFNEAARDLAHMRYLAMTGLDVLRVVVPEDAVP